MYLSVCVCLCVRARLCWGARASAHAPEKKLSAAERKRRALRAVQHAHAATMRRASHSNPRRTNNSLATLIHTHTAASAEVTRVTRSLARSLVRAVDRRAHKMCMLQEHFAHTHVLKRSRSRALCSARLFRGTSSSCCMPVSLCPRVRVCVCVCCLCCWPVRASWGDCALVHCITLRSVRVCRPVEVLVSSRRRSPRFGQRSNTRRNPFTLVAGRPLVCVCVSSPRLDNRFGGLAVRRGACVLCCAPPSQNRLDTEGNRVRVHPPSRPQK